MNRVPRIGCTPAPWPSVGVVVTGADRTHGVAWATASVLAQDYPGPVSIVVSHERTAVPAVTDGSAERPVRLLANWRTPGVAGARNSGVLALDSDLVAFCGDRDTWLPGKLTAQVRALCAEPFAEVASCAAEVDRGGRRRLRLAGRTRIGPVELGRSRTPALPLSGLLVRRSALVTTPDGIGLPSEDLPDRADEDPDLLRRAAHRAPIVHVDVALVRMCGYPGTASR